jgi:hypothetical protein
VGGFAGIPRNMTTVAQVMKRAGYSTHMVGKVGCFVIPAPASSALPRRQSASSMRAHTHCLARRPAQWDVGMATPTHTPGGRGYDSTLIYFDHANDYWTFRDGNVCHNSTPGIDITGSGLKYIINYEDGTCGVSGWASFTGGGHPPVYVQLSIDGTAYGPRQEANISRPDAPRNPGLNGWKVQFPCSRIDAAHNLSVAAFATSTSTSSAWSTTACVADGNVVPCAPDAPMPVQLGSGKSLLAPVDMWNYPPGGQPGIPRTGRPGYEYVNAESCTKAHHNTSSAGEKCQYEDAVFEARVHEIISRHTDKWNKIGAPKDDEPLFIFWAPHIVHGVLKVAILCAYMLGASYFTHGLTIICTVCRTAGSARCATSSL